MAKLARVTASDFIRVIERLGFEFQRSKGSHRIYRHPETGRRVIVAFHRSRVIPPGTLLNMLREAGLSKQEFEELL